MLISKKIYVVLITLFALLISSPHLCAKNKNKKPGWKILNELFEVPIWSDYNLWDDPETNVALRLKIPKESRTPYQVIYRAYTGGKAKILGEPCYSFALFGNTGNITSISIFFANKGDLEGLAHDVSNDNIIQEEALSTYKSKISEAQIQVEDKLTSLLRNPKIQSFGEGDKNTVESVKRWDVKGHAIMLAAPQDEYVSIRIVPTKIADAEGKIDSMTDEEVKKRMNSCVVRRDNGDVIIKDIPMINQGPKGYCVPATWARYFNYIGIPVDMYLLAMAGDTGVGGGTSIRTMVNNVNRLVEKHNRRMKYDKRRALIKYIDEYIDRGVPIMWPVYVDKEFYVDRINERTEERKTVKDFDKWKEKLKPYNREAKNLGTSHNGGHICMIIGYNKKTREIATSDSWGEKFNERWMTEKEIDAISMGGMYVIKW